MIISFDIWDTIIKRRCHPEEVKLHTANHIMLKYEKKLKEKYKDIYEILNLRDNIEAEECKRNKETGHDEECKILEVFEKLQQEIFKEKIENIAEELLKEEIEQEKRVIFVNPEILPIFEKYKDLKMYCISDFYMGAEALKELLDSLKLPVKFEKIYSSADYLLNKRTGKLYKKAEEEIGIVSKEHIHVGDNQFSDIEMAKNLGIETIKTTKTEFNFIPEKGRKFEFDLTCVKKEDKLFNSGVDLAPILYFLGYSIVEYAIKNNIPKVYYLTREGETFIKIHELIKENNPFGVTIPECDTLEVSRMATFSASLNEFSISELLRLWSQYRVQSMKTLFKTLAIDINPYKEFMGKYDIRPEEDIVNPWFDFRVQKLCADKKFSEKINCELKRKREELLEYFEKKKGITNNNDSMFVVDIGWRGTIQDNLAYIFTNKKIEGYYLTLYDFYNLQPENTKKISFIDDKNIRDNEVSNMITLLEWIYNPGTASVVEYEQGEAIRKAKTEEIEIVKKYIKPLQEGMLEGAKVINEYMKNHPYEAEETKKYVYEVIKETKKKPSKELIEAYYSMVFNDTFGAAEYVEKDDKLSTMQRLNIFKCRNMLRNEMWKEAFIVHNDIKYMNTILNAKSTLRKILGKG
ncbi:MAG: HAD-IA family hydrolase [Bacilli bacterium]|nr:HAD-IA family hydrolase [Bacilli bacterium]